MTAAAGGNAAAACGGSGVTYGGVSVMMVNFIVGPFS